jgi:hypothetical protein
VEGQSGLNWVDVAPAWTSHNFGWLRFPMVVEGFLASGRILGRNPEGRRWLGQASRSCSIDTRSDASEMLASARPFPIPRGEPVSYLSKIYRRLASRSVSRRRRLARGSSRCWWCQPDSPDHFFTTPLIGGRLDIDGISEWGSWAGEFEWAPGPGLDAVLLSVAGDREVRTPEEPSAGFRVTDMAPPRCLWVHEQLLREPAER